MPNLFLLPGNTGKRVIVWTALFFIGVQAAPSACVSAPCKNAWPTTPARRWFWFSAVRAP
jgi:hypothetical protein